MKKTLIFLCSLMLLCSAVMPAAAQETLLTATVPDRHTVTIESEGGKVAADNEICTDTLSAERHKEQTYWLLSDPGKTVDKVLYNGVDVTAEVKNSVYTAPRLVRDAVLTVIYKDAPKAPDNKEYNVSGTVQDSNGKPVSDVTVDIGGFSGKTDKNGRFEIKDLPSGTHTVAITDKNGKITAHGTITIDKTDEKNLVLTIDANGNPVIVPSNETKNMSLVMVINADGSITVKSVNDETPVIPSKLPDTGISGGQTQWLLVLLAGALTAAGAAVFVKRKRQRKYN